MTSMLYKVKLDDVIAGSQFIAPDTRVSKNSKYEDPIWDFTDSDSKRQSSISRGRLQINWGMYCTVRDTNNLNDHRSALIPKQMVDELKVFAILYLSLPSAFVRRGKQSVKPQTLVLTVRALIRLFSDVLLRYQLIGLVHKATLGPIRSLADVSLRNIREVLENSQRVDGKVLKKGLTLLTNQVLAKAFPFETLQWNLNDLNSLNFKNPIKRTDYERVMPNELFRFLSNSACADVLEFLRFISHTPLDKSIHQSCRSFGSNSINGSQLFLDYLAIRKADSDYALRSGKKHPASKTLRIRFKSIHGVSPKEVFWWFYRVQRAAFTVIGLYTGARYSDLTTFTTDCVHTFHGLHVLTGTHVKNKALDDKEDYDLWPAIPIMRDAVACLEYFSKITLNNYLLCSSETLAIGETPKALSLNGFTEAVTNYLHEVDTSHRWTDWHINAHQLRHSLAHQLARADVGLVFIAHQMKHLHTALHALPPDVTMMYGNIGDLSTQKALHSESAYLEAAKELYGPDRPVAGGGAEAFMARRKVYFEGMAAQGWEVDEIIENLAKQGLPFASVGIGYCGGRRETRLKDGTKELPPCIGSLQCNPGICSQAVITKTHEASWQKIHDQNKTLASDPRMAHAIEPLLAAMNAAEQVLTMLNPKPAEPY
jgi:hypothetical protein